MLTESAFKVFAQIENGKISPSYFCIGEDYFLQEKMIDTVWKKIKSKYPDAEKSIFYGEEDCTQALYSELFNVGMFGSHRLVVYKNVTDFDKVAKKLLIRYFSNPSPGTVFVIFYKGKKLPDFVSSMGKHLKFVDLSPPRHEQVSEVVKEYFKTKGYNVDNEAVELLKLRAGEDLSILLSEVEKILIYVGDRKSIRAEDVEEIVGFTKKYSIQNFRHYLSQREKNKVIECALSLMDAGEKMPFITSVLTNFFIDMWASDEKDGKKRNKYYRTEHASYRNSDFRAIFKRLVELDLKSKTTGVPGRDLLIPVLTEILLSE